VFRFIKNMTARLLFVLMGLASRVSPALRVRIDLEKMDALTLTLMEQIRDVSGEYRNQIDSLEVAILGSFMISETYLPQSGDSTSARELLDKYHR
jgi:hypothetical protein